MLTSLQIHLIAAVTGFQSFTETPDDVCKKNPFAAASL